MPILGGRLYCAIKSKDMLNELSQKLKLILLIFDEFGKIFDFFAKFWVFRGSFVGFLGAISIWRKGSSINYVVGGGDPPPRSRLNSPHVVDYVTTTVMGGGVPPPNPTLNKTRPKKSP